MPEYILSHTRKDGSRQQTVLQTGMPSTITDVVWPRESFQHCNTTTTLPAAPLFDHTKSYFGIQSNIPLIPKPIREDDNEDKIRSPVPIAINFNHDDLCSDVSSLYSGDSEGEDNRASSWATNVGTLEEEEDDSILSLSSIPVSLREREELVLMDGEEMAGLFDESKVEPPTVVSVAQNSEESIGLFNEAGDGRKDNIAASLEDTVLFDSVPTIFSVMHDLNHIEQIDVEVASAVSIKDGCCKVCEDNDSIFSIAPNSNKDSLKSLNLNQAASLMPALKSQANQPALKCRHKKGLPLHPQTVTVILPYRSHQPKKYQPDLLAPSLIPDEMIYAITNFLDVKSLIQLRIVSMGMRLIASRDEAGWADACQNLWGRKVNVSAEAIEMLRLSTERRFLGSLGPKKYYIPRYGAMGAFRVSVRDSMRRDEVTLDELCHNIVDLDSDLLPEDILKEGGPIWSFRFKESAGVDWTGWDPWWNGAETRRMVFLRDGRAMQVVEEEGEGKEENLMNRSADGTIPISDSKQVHDDSHRPRKRRRILQTAFSDGIDIIRRQPHAAHEYPDMLAIRPPRIDVRWHLVCQPMDQPHRPIGTFVRLTVGGRDVPTYVVRRSPTGNWGFVMESCWGIFANFDLPPRRVQVEGRTGRVAEDSSAVGRKLSDTALMGTNSSQ